MWTIFRCRGCRYSLHLIDRAEQVELTGRQFQALEPLSQFLAFPEDPSIIGAERIAFRNLFHQQKVFGILIVFLQDTHQSLIGAAARRQIVQVLLEGGEDIGGEDGQTKEILQHFAVNFLPLFSVRLHPIPIFHERDQVSQFVDQRDQERISVQAAIDADTMVPGLGGMAVIPSTLFRSLVIVRWT